jgi:uncharacterized glyoxalase superfamily protein PhnB
MSKVDAIPKGYHTITPTLTVSDAKAAIEFYNKAFGAEEIQICTTPDGKQVMHAEIKIGDSIIMLNDEYPSMGVVGPKSLGGTTGSMFFYTENVDLAFERAIKAGATEVMPVSDQFWGDRFGCVVDPFGHKWGLSTHVADLSKEEIDKAQKEWTEKNKQMAHAK